MTRKPPLATAELAVMKLLWQHGTMTAKEILEATYPESSTSQHGTVQRLLQRLEENMFSKQDALVAASLFVFAIFLNSKGLETRMEASMEKMDFLNRSFCYEVEHIRSSTTKTDNADFKIFEFIRNHCNFCTTRICV